MKGSRPAAPLDRRCYAALVLALALAPAEASATSIRIADVGDTATTPDGVTFIGLNPGAPSTGTGVLDPFVRLQGSAGSGGLQAGYNTGASQIELDAKRGPRALALELLLSLPCNDAQGRAIASGCYGFVLDANERASGTEIEIDLTAVQIFVSEVSDLFGYEMPFDPATNRLGGLLPIYSLDNAANQDVTVTLSASINATHGKGGSGKGDLSLLVPVDLIGSQRGGFLYFYTEYGRASGGFEEWAAVVVPEPRTALLLAWGIAILLLGRCRVWRIRAGRGTADTAGQQRSIVSPGTGAGR